MIDYLLEGTDFSNIVVLDAGTGAGNTTLELATRMAEAGGKGRIVSVDIDPETFPDAKKKLEELARFVEFVEADLTCMPQMESESFDLIVCTATMCALNDRPLKAVKALSEFYRTLKKGGWLVIDDEYPLFKASKPQEEVQVRRWQTYKSVAELVDGEHYTEIYPEELEFAARVVGFKEIELKIFVGGPLSTNAMNEWREVMPEMISKIDNEDLKTAFEKATERIWRTYKKQGGIFPPYYVMRMRK